MARLGNDNRALEPVANGRKRARWLNERHGPVRPSRVYAPGARPRASSAWGRLAISGRQCRVYTDERGASAACSAAEHRVCRNPHGSRSEIASRLQALDLATAGQPA